MNKPIKKENPEPKHTVWVIEDNEEFSRQIAGLLNLSDSFACERVFAACEPAIDLLRDGELPDVILMDIGLPGMSGIEGVREIKAMSPSIEIVILTVFEDNQKIFEAISAGASGYLHKSSSLEVIVDSLESILAGGAPINPQIARSVLEMFARFSNPQRNYHLSPREKEILRFLVDGLTKKEIADKIFLSFHTIDNHVRNIYGKLRVQTRGGAVAKALKERLL
ncbi:MAG TPA: response regulator transcription factor [Bacteroidota bacterium]|nr:response regulator transcription factor [Bacteroidota bacterium]